MSQLCQWEKKPCATKKLDVQLRSAAALQQVRVKATKAQGVKSEAAANATFCCEAVTRCGLHRIRIRLP